MCIWSTADSRVKIRIFLSIWWINTATKLSPRKCSGRTRQPLLYQSQVVRGGLLNLTTSPSEDIDASVTETLTKRLSTTLRHSAEAIKEGAHRLRELLTQIGKYFPEVVTSDINSNLGKKAEQLFSLASFVLSHSN